jgi:cytochrome o ubiquinol oxidase subunit 2
MTQEALLLSRLQFARVIAWRVLRPVFTVGLASFIAFMEGLYFATRRETYLRISIIVNSGKRRRGPADAGENRPIPRTSISPDPTRLSAGRWMHKAAAWGRGATLCVMVLLLTACDGDTHLTFLNPQGPVADAQRWHFYEVLGVMMVLVAGPIFLLLPFFAWRYRYGNTASKYTPKWEFSRMLEITAWSGPIVIVAVLAFFVWRDTHRLDPYKPLVSDQAQLHVQVIGYDWKWLFIYPDQGIASIGILAMPAGGPVSMQITSATVMQSLFIPALGSQIYAMGGMVTRLNLLASKPGRFMGENTMYNGNGFHQQQFTAVAMTPDDFKAWVSKVRANGIPLDAQTLQIISRRATRSDLIAALPKAKAMDGQVYLTSVSKTLFPAVVEAIMDGKTTLPQAAFGHVGTATSGAENAAPSTPEQSNERH